MSDSYGISIDERTVHVVSSDGAAADAYLLRPSARLREAIVWLPALGVAARHYLPFAQALAEQGIAAVLHEWRGIGSSDRRAGRASDWGYRELLEFDLPATLAAAREAFPGARIWLGGHSLGGQLAALYAGLHAGEYAGLLLVASGSPYWRTFPWYRGIGVVVIIAPWIAALRGHFPGRLLGFGGNEARGLIADWARSGRSGRYAAAGVEGDLEQRLSALRLPILAARLQDDWLAPEPSLAWLLGKLPQARIETASFASADLGGAPANHFAWMKAPLAIAGRISAFIARS